MRVALVAPLVSAIAQPYLGGAQALLADLAQGLLRRRHSVILFARDDLFCTGNRYCILLFHVKCNQQVLLRNVSDQLIQAFSLRSKHLS